MGRRLIDADELIALIDDDIAAYKDGYFEDFELPPTAYGSLCALRMVREYIKALPTVEPTPATCLGCNCPKMEKLEAEPYIGFCEWVADTVLYEDFEDKWTLGAFAEVACRKLRKLGFIRKDGEYWGKDEVEE